MRWWLGMVVALVVVAGAAGAAQLQLEGELRQGGLVFGRVAAGSEAWLDDRQLLISADGWFVFGFGRDSGPTAELVVHHADGREERRTLKVAARDYQTERIDGLPPGKVTPQTEAEIARIQADARLIKRAKDRNSALSGFTETMGWPVQGPITGVYGSQRILNGKPRSPHRGIDVAAAEGTPIDAIAGGVVSLAEADMYFTGGTVMIDHGHGVHSIYAHMSAVEVEVGQAVARGERIGAVGATGRVTGPHLHWGVYWFGRAVDPAPLVGPMPDTG